LTKLSSYVFVRSSLEIGEDMKVMGSNDHVNGWAGYYYYYDIPVCPSLGGRKA
jgi:hypothetical protein